VAVGKESAVAAIGSVNVSGGGDAKAVAAALARILGQPAPTFTGDNWPVKVTEDVTTYVEDDRPEENDGYEVDIDVWSWPGREATEAATAEVYDLLVRKTDWSLRLLTVGGAPIAHRPAVTRAS